jgi:exopolyphosphatase/guanosine-5'-triphosphate,3'-diphosphate pyrophosphatase
MDEVRVTGLDPALGPQAERRGRSHVGGPMKWTGERATTYAALDLGTNNCRLLVARASGQGFRVIDAFSRIIRLGEGIATTGRISDAAIARAVEALSVCRDKITARSVSRMRLIATEACRAASNGEAFLSEIAAKVGIVLEVIDRETEALLAATGCTPLIEPQARGVVLFDIGGGSSEIVRMGQAAPAGAGPPQPRIEGWTSLPLGVVTLAEKFGGVDVTPQSFAAMIDCVADALTPFVARHGGDIEGMHLLGTSGTVTTVAGVHLRLPRYERRRVDGCWMSGGDIDAVVGALAAMSYKERVANPCIGAERADLVLAGCAILEAIRRAFPCPRLRVADRGLREGMLVQMMREDGAWSRS